MLQKHPIVMLPTKLASVLSLNSTSNILEYVHDFMDKESNYINQYLYILSQHKIKKGDWILNLSRFERGDNVNPHICNGEEGYNLSNGWLKIIATNDPVLSRIEIEESDSVYKIPQYFIKNYIERVNSGSKVNRVLVEYNHPHDNAKFNFEDNTFELTMTLFTNDTIFVNLIEEEEPSKKNKLYTREEVKQILFKWSMYKVDIELDKLADELGNIQHYDEWFEENYPQ